MPATWQPSLEAESLHIISLTHGYRKENRREHCRRFAWLNFCRSCLQLMTSRNIAVNRYHGIFETAYYRRAYPNTAHPQLTIMRKLLFMTDYTCTYIIIATFSKIWSSRCKSSVHFFKFAWSDPPLFRQVSALKWSESRDSCHVSF